MSASTMMPNNWKDFLRVDGSKNQIVGVLVTWGCSPSTGIGLGTVYNRHTYYVEFSAPLVGHDRHTYYVEFSAPLVGHDSSQEEANTCLFLPAAIA